MSRNYFLSEGPTNIISKETDDDNNEDSLYELVSSGLSSINDLDTVIKLLVYQVSRSLVYGFFSESRRSKMVFRIVLALDNRGTIAVPFLPLHHLVSQELLLLEIEWETETFSI